MFPRHSGSLGQRNTIATMGQHGTITPYSISGNASGAFPTAKKVLYMPIRIDSPVDAYQIFVINGSSVSGNIDIGLYTAKGIRLLNSGSVAQAGTTQKQLYNFTDFRLGRGVYYLAVTLDNTTGTFIRSTTLTAQLSRLFGWKTETTGTFGLPATATFSPYADAYTCYMGVLAQTVI